MIFIVDKPSGMTSQGAVSRVKRMMGGKVKIGHTGTLDPMCTGVLPMLTDADTKLSDLFDGDKEYIATFKLGIVTDTQDITGQVLNTFPTEGIQEDKVKEVLSSFVGTREQVPPMYSAVKIDGKKLYELAREGIEVERKARQVTFYEIEYLGFKDGDYKMRVSCSKGTYIRTLIHDIGSLLGCGAAMTSLRRTKANGFDISQARPLEEVMKIAEEKKLAEISVNAEKCFEKLSKCIIPNNGLKYYLNGGTIAYSRLSVSFSESEKLLRAYNEDSEFLGLCVPEEEGVKAIWSKR